MNLEDFARHIGMPLPEVVRLAERGKLPCEKVGGRWRFNRARVTEWLQERMPTLNEDRLLAIERAMASDDPEGRTTHIVTGLMSVDGIDMAVRAGSRSSVLRELVALAERTDLLYDKEGLLDAVNAREDMCSTALPNGVAIPHPRQPMPYASAEPFICLARAPQGVPFGSPDGVLTYLFFLICSHEDRQHLQILARLVRILDKDTVDALRETTADDEALALLIRREEQVAERGK
jgi:PTS system nitrogen regulatory IIA component